MATNITDTITQTAVSLSTLCSLPTKAIVDSNYEAAKEFIHEFLRYSATRCIIEYINKDDNTDIISHSDYITLNDDEKENYIEYKALYKMKSAVFDVLSDETSQKYNVPLAFFLPTDNFLSIDEAEIEFGIDLTSIQEVKSEQVIDIFNENNNTNVIQQTDENVNYIAFGTIKKTVQVQSNNSTNQSTKSNIGIYSKIKLKRSSNNLSQLVEKLRITTNNDNENGSVIR